MSDQTDVRWDEQRGQWFSRDGRMWNGSDWVWPPYEPSADQRPPRPVTPVYQLKSVRYLLLGVVALVIVGSIGFFALMFAIDAGWID